MRHMHICNFIELRDNLSGLLVSAEPEHFNTNLLGELSRNQGVVRDEEHLWLLSRQQVV